jgi:hypothetical protein
MLSELVLPDGVAKEICCGTAVCVEAVFALWSFFTVVFVGVESARVLVGGRRRIVHRTARP